MFKRWIYFALRVHQENTDLLELRVAQDLLVELVYQEPRGREEKPDLRFAVSSLSFDSFSV